MAGTIEYRRGRVSRGHAQRSAKALRLAAVGAVTLMVGSGSAWAECRRSGTGASVTVLDLVPLASGTAISSMIATINAVNSSSLAQSSAFATAPTTGGNDISGGGRWSRIIAGTDDVEANTKVTGTVSGFPSAADDSCNSTTRLNYIGTQAGVDVGHFKFNNGANVQWGFTAGYVDVEAKDKTPGIGTFSSDNQVAFGGVYLALSKGNFSFDAQVRGDYYSMALSDVDNALFNQPLTARGVAALANAAYRFDLKDNWFVEPSIGGVFSQTDVNPLDVSGAIDLPGTLTQSLTLPGSVQVGTITSLLARASLRFGTTIVTPTMAWQPFGTLSVFHEFGDDVQTTMTTGPGALSLGGASIPINATATTERLGTFGHVGVGLAGVVLNTGWLGYVRGDYRFGDNIEALSVNAGLRYQFEPARMGDGSVKDGGYAAAPFNWSGLYIGMNSGGLWGKQDWLFDAFGTKTSPSFAGYLVGGQVGYDHQVGNVVFGVEADYNWSNAEGGESCPNKSSFSCAAAVDQLGLFTARLGFASDRALYYVKGGLAYADVTATTKWNYAGNLVGVPWARPDLTVSSTKSLTGWAAGVGMEFAIDNSWTARGEVLHYDLGNEKYELTGGPVLGVATVETTGTIARVGVNYRFGNRGYGHEGHDTLK